MAGPSKKNMTLANSSHFIEIPYSFIEEHLPYAPGDFIKVYLVVCYYNAYKKPLVSEISNRLNSREAEVINALEYWQGKGVLTIRNEAETWVELNQTLSSGKKRGAHLYTDKDYNDTLQKLFGTHILKTNEFELIYDWTDVLNLPKEVAMMVIEYSISRKGRNVNISYMNAVAKSWAEKGIDSVETAMAEIDRYERISGGANRVLSFIGVSGRLPSRPEMDLYQKWTMEWGFTQDAILMAIGDISATTNPSFNYIDSVLGSLKSKGATTSRKVSETKADESKTRNEAKELLSMLGLKMNQPNIKRISALKDVCASEAVLKLAFGEAAKRQTPSLNYVKTVLESWQAQGLKTKADVTAYLTGRNDFQTSAISLFKKAGVKTALNEAHYNAYLQWTNEDMFAPDLLSAVAEASAGANNPFQYMTKVLANLKEKGMLTKGAFEKETVAKKGSDAAIRQRSYSSEDFQSVLDELDFGTEAEE